MTKWFLNFCDTNRVVRLMFAPITDPLTAFLWRLLIIICGSAFIIGQIERLLK